MFLRRGRHAFYVAFLIALSLAVSACGKQTPSDKPSILDQVNIDLSSGDCADALTTITPLYNSSSSDNDVRMAMASVYACEAGFNFFGFFTKAESANLTNQSALFELFAQEFPSTSSLSDKVVESAGYGIDALMAILNPGTVLVAGDLFNTATDNEGSLLYTDRSSSANEYMLWLSMAVMGGLENRIGAASGTGAPTNSPALSWTTASASGMQTAAGLDASGCEFASALVNFADVMAQLTATCSSNPSATDVPCYLAKTLNTITETLDSSPVNNPGTKETFSQAIYDACNYGCTNTTPNANADKLLFSPLGGWQASGCTSTGLPSCDQCPMLLRNRNNCAGTTTDQTSCAAAGVINFVNNAALGWQ